MYQNVLVALDGSETAEAILPHVIPLAEKFGATVTLLRARTPTIAVVSAMGNGSIPGPAADPTPILEAEEQEVNRYLAAVDERLRQAGVSTRSVAPEGPAASAIVDHAREVGADLIALTTHGRGGLERAVFGSVADSVLRHAPCPILLVRIRGDE